MPSISPVRLGVNDYKRRTLSKKIRNNLNKRKKLLASPQDTWLFDILKKAPIIIVKDIEQKNSLFFIRSIVNYFNLCA